jgi:hypothetical protein
MDELEGLMLLWLAFFRLEAAPALEVELVLAEVYQPRRQGTLLHRPASGVPLPGFDITRAEAGPNVIERTEDHTVWLRAWRVFFWAFADADLDSWDQFYATLQEAASR